MKQIIFVSIIFILMCPFTAEARGHSGGGGKSHSSKATPKYTYKAPVAKPVSKPSSPTQVKQYVKKDGIIVAPHVRSHEDKTRANNYSTKGNINPNTGKPGTKPLIKPIVKK